MALTDGDVAALARAAVDRIDPALEVSIDPADSLDPYRFGSPAWTVSAGGASSYLTAGMTPDEATAKLLEDLGRSAP